MTGLYAEAARSLAEEFTRQTGIQVNIVEANLSACGKRN